MYAVLKPKLKRNFKGWFGLSLVLAMAGLGLGAVNEIIEFTATVIMTETGVGGYVNTALDLVADMIGSVGAVVYIWLKNK
jgi:hypothetical protein